MSTTKRHLVHPNLATPIRCAPRPEQRSSPGFGSGFSWSQVGGRDEAWRGPKPFDDSDGADEGEGEEEEGKRDDDDDDDAYPADPERFLENLARVMGGSGAGSLRSWQRGGVDPWGQSTSDAWLRRAREQQRGWGGGGSGDDSWQPPGRQGDGGGGGREWGPPRPPPGWAPPGRGGSEWSHPRRAWDEEDQRGGGGGGLPGRGPPPGGPRPSRDDGGFRGKPL